MLVLSQKKNESDEQTIMQELISVLRAFPTNGIAIVDPLIGLGIHELSINKELHRGLQNNAKDTDVNTYYTQETDVHCMK